MDQDGEEHRVLGVEEHMGLDEVEHMGHEIHDVGHDVGLDDEELDGEDRHNLPSLGNVCKDSCDNQDLTRTRKQLCYNQPEIKQC